MLAFWWLASVYADLHDCKSQNGLARKLPKWSCEMSVDFFSQDHLSQDHFGTPEDRESGRVITRGKAEREDEI